MLCTPHSSWMPRPDKAIKANIQKARVNLRLLFFWQGRWNFLSAYTSQYLGDGGSEVDIYRRRHHFNFCRLSSCPEL